VNGVVILRRRRYHGGIVDLLLLLIVILFILLIWRGPQMLPQLGEALGKAVKGVRDNVDRDTPAEAAPPPSEPAATQGHDEDDPHRDA
jgi:Sec-independent protein translocase protein TatA